MHGLPITNMYQNKPLNSISVNVLKDPCTYTYLSTKNLNI